MLFPISNTYRQCIDLSGIWVFKPDPEDRGQQDGWHKGFEQTRPIAVPASWNDHYSDLREFLGPAWYSRQFTPPWGWENSRILVRFNSVNYLTKVWLNGHELGTHEGGHLPFVFDVTEQLSRLENTLILRVDGRLAGNRVPPGNVTGSDLDFFTSHSENYPQTQFDFFPYCGIQRPVLLYCQPMNALDDITVIPELTGEQAHLHVGTDSNGSHIRVTLSSQDRELIEVGTGAVQIDLRDPRKWSPEDPFLYDLHVELLDNHLVMDAYSLPIGIRTIAVDGTQLLLNNKPIYLKGFGRHEDFPVSGRGLNTPVIIKDYALLRWIGANSFRTSHYPYSEQMMSMADQLGFLVIDETPAVGLFFNVDGFDRRLALCKNFTYELIQRDKNHPSVIAWSLANEPHSGREEAKPFFRELYNLAKTLDPSRPVTLASCMGVAEKAFEFLDFLCLNRYFGWYQESGQIHRGIAFLSAELDLLYETFRKPLVLTEFGADALPGHHAQPPEMFSEEFQAEFITAYINLLREKPYVVGEHVWNMCDFKTAQGITRMGGLNHKGVYTRDRRPKLAAHRLREIWKSEENLR
jgi:beta-glucuronidase